MTYPKPNDQRRAPVWLDAKLGPARQLSQGDAEWLVEQVVERALQPAKQARQRLFGVRSLSLAALAVATTAAAASVVHQVRKSPDATALEATKPQRSYPKQSSRAEPPLQTHAPTMDPEDDAKAAVPVHESTPPPSSSILPVAKPASAADQLSAANELRRKAQWKAAEAAYSLVAARSAGTQEGYVAQLAAAELRLGHLGDPAGALRLFQTLPRGNPLGVEALFGASRAHRALLDRSAEAADLRSLIEAYPTSLQADGARARLKQLDTPSDSP